MSKKVLVAMSGGVDSSVAAYLLKEQGEEVTGLTMCLGSEGGGAARCCGADAIADARRVCEKLQISHFVFDYAREFEDKVIGKYVTEYGRGRTPNPCVDCNRYLKFGTLLAQAEALGFDYLATGHYAQIVREEGFFLKRPRDRVKDQTYFLYALAPAALEKILFPLASLTKDEVRAIAGKAGLPVAEKRESQDLCFVDKHNHADFMARRIPGSKPGPIVDRQGKQLGTHRGIAHYTIGKRSGLGIAHPVPLYVLSLDAAANRVVVGEKGALKARGLVAEDVHRLVEDWPPEVSAKIRYRRKAAPCDVVFAQGKITTLFKEEEEAITPGQAVVYYHGDYVLGGGTIAAVL